MAIPIVKDVIAKSDYYKQIIRFPRFKNRGIRSKKDNLSIPMAFFFRFLAVRERKLRTNYEINTCLGIAVRLRLLKTE